MPFSDEVVVRTVGDVVDEVVVGTVDEVVVDLVELVVVETVVVVFAVVGPESTQLTFVFNDFKY